ncbi:MAG: cytochrome C oxidase subunit IV family protein [Acidobacteria bacterium]|nr:cytochrome C oxidase subunit IV family protein [Acidobacteriota bacterium]
MSAEHTASGHHIVPIQNYVLIFLALLVGTGITVTVAYYDMDVTIGSVTIPFNTVIAMAIAGFKATLVVLYFMHVRYGSRLTWIFVGAGLFWLILLITLTVSDYMTRESLHSFLRGVLLMPSVLLQRVLELSR